MLVETLLRALMPLLRVTTCASVWMVQYMILTNIPLRRCAPWHISCNLPHFPRVVARDHSTTYLQPHARPSCPIHQIQIRSTQPQSAGACVTESKGVNTKRMAIFAPQSGYVPRRTPQAGRKGNVPRGALSGAPQEQESGQMGTTLCSRVKVPIMGRPKQLNVGMYKKVPAQEKAVPGPILKCIAQK